MYEFPVRRAGGVAARLQHLATVVLGLYDVRDLLGSGPGLHHHVAHYFTYCRENVAVSPPFQQSLTSPQPSDSAQEPLRVVAASDGIIVRGVGTQAPYANELFCLTAPRPNLTPERRVL